MSRLPTELTSEDDLTEARVQLDRCASEADFARWARTYGSPLVEGARELSHTNPGFDFDGDE